MDPTHAVTSEAAAGGGASGSAGAAAPWQRGARRARRGVLDPRRVRIAAFTLIVAALLGTAATCILAVWNYVPHDVGWRAVATLGIVVATALTFAAINEFFGARLDG